MSLDRSPITAAEVQKWFLDSEPPEKNTFDLALVLGGTVAAGAYTAGVMDYLIEALDEWYRLKQEGDPSAPGHHLRLRLITGTSGGGVIASIAARALAYRFEHVTKARLDRLDGNGPPRLRTDNPFYDTWVHDLNLPDLLEDGDLENGHVRSLLNGRAIDVAAERVTSFHGNPIPQRPWVASPLRVTVTVTNLCGIPYRTDLGGGLGQQYVNHADFARFAVVYPWQRLAPASQRPDEWAVAFGNGSVEDWKRLAEYAKATGAFPVGFPARALKRPMDHYRYRVAVLPGDGIQPARVVPTLPHWDALIDKEIGEVPSEYRFLAVDGGATDNEPIQLARTALSGCLGHNPRQPDKADRAVMLVDPFASHAELGLREEAKLPAVAKSILTALKEQNRFSTSDILLANDPEVFSRFMITPRRTLHGQERVGGEALATAGLSAFIGFACKDYMRHDFLLGRANAKEYLAKEFVLREDNPIFAGMWTGEQKERHGIREEDGLYLPIIPALGSASAEQETAEWPAGKLDKTAMRKGVESRIKMLANKGGGDGLLGLAIKLLAAFKADDLTDDYIMKAVDTYLKDAKL